jgi:DNA-binding transcriptional LysR family regulator
MDLNLRSLDVFVQIAESGGMSTTARRMGLTQSAVSQMIANLENSLGVQLFDRQVRPLALTPPGGVLLEKARALLRSARETIQATQQHAEPAFPKVSLSLVETVAATIGPQLFCGIRDLAKAWTVQRGPHFEHAAALLSREADVIVTSDAMEDEPHLERYEILKEPFLLALPLAFDASDEAPDLTAIAERHEFIRFSSRTMIGRQIERHLRRRRVVSRGKIEFDTPDALLAAVAAGYGWAVVTPLAALAGRMFWPEIAFAPLAEPNAFRQIHAIARQGELGSLPKTIADAAAACIDLRFAKELKRGYPWMIEGCVLREMPVAEGERRSAPALALATTDVQPSASSALRLPLPDLAPWDKPARSS